MESSSPVSRTTFKIIICVLLAFGLYQVVSMIYIRPYIYICSGERASEVVMYSEHAYTLLAPQETQTALECVGRVVPFFQKHIRIYGSISTVKDKTISQYYSVIHISNLPHINSAKMIDSVLFIDQGNKLILIPQKAKIILLDRHQVAKFDSIILVRNQAAKSIVIFKEQGYTKPVNEEILRKGEVRKYVLK